MENIAEILQKFVNFTIENKSTIFLTFTSVLALFISFMTIHENVRSASYNRYLSAISECHKRFIELERRRHAHFSKKSKLSSQEKIDEYQEEVAELCDSFFREFWTLKSDQFRFWLAGFVDHDSFLNWNQSTLRHFRKGTDEFYGKSFIVGWANIGRPYHVETNPLFVRFHDALSQICNKKRSVVDDAKLIMSLMMSLESKNKGGFFNVFRANKKRRFALDVSILNFQKDFSILFDDDDFSRLFPEFLIEGEDRLKLIDHGVYLQKIHENKMFIEQEVDSSTSETE